MLKSIQWAEDRAYRTGGEAEPIQFYMDGLCNSKQMDLLLGYFSYCIYQIIIKNNTDYLFIHDKNNHSKVII
jgi:hypothetical protein